MKYNLLLEPEYEGQLQTYTIKYTNLSIATSS